MNGRIAARILLQLAHSRIPRLYQPDGRSLCISLLAFGRPTTAEGTVAERVDGNGIWRLSAPVSSAPLLELYSSVRKRQSLPFIAVGTWVRIVCRELNS